MRTISTNKQHNYKQFLVIPTFLAILLVITVALLATYLLVVGQKWTGVSDTFPEELAPNYQPTVIERYEPYPAAIFPLTASALLLLGLMIRKKLLVFAWVGLVILFIFSALFLFSSGAAFLPIASLLLACLITITFVQRKEKAQPEVS